MKRLPGLSGSPVVAATLAFLLVLLGPVGTASAVAQQTGLIDNHTYVTATSGHRITWSSPWSFREEYQNADEPEMNGEMILLTAGGAEVIVGFAPMSYNASVGQVLNSSLTASEDFDLTVLDQGADDSGAYVLGLASVQGTNLGLFSLVQPAPGGVDSMVTFYFGTVFGFGEGMASAQRAITVDDQPIFAGIEPAGLQKQLTAAQENPPPAGATPVPTTPSQTTVSSDLQKLGLVSEGKYRSPQYKTNVTWGTDWELAEESGKPLITSDPKLKLDELEIVRKTGALAYVRVTIMPSRGIAADGYADLWSDPHYVLQRVSPGAEVLLADSETGSSAALFHYVGEQSGSEFVILREAHAINGGKAIAFVQVVTLARSASEVFPAVENEITLDGASILQTVSAEEILAAI